MPPDIEAFVHEEISSGRFANREAVIEHALRFLQSDREEAVTGIRLGLEDVAAGRAQPLATAFEDLRGEFKMGTR
jgi:Arc/MetJ-type ribon-helix-helix transcriptional regulator